MSITYTTVTDPRYGNPNKTSILCQVKFDHLDSPVGFLASPQDVEKHGQTIFQECIDQKYGLIADYSPPTFLPSYLINSTQTKTSTLINSGVTIRLNSNGSLLNFLVDTSPTGRADLSSLVQMATANSDYSTTWYQSSGNIPISSSQILELNNLVTQWIQSIYAAQSAVILEINSNPPTIINPDQINSYNWPSNTYPNIG